MKRLNHHLSPSTEADLQKLIEPIASYIASVGRPRVALIEALILLINTLQEINEAANHCLDSFSENRMD